VYHPAVRALALAGFSGYASAAMPRRWCRMTSVRSSCADQRPTWRSRWLTWRSS